MSRPAHRKQGINAWAHNVGARCGIPAPDFDESTFSLPRVAVWAMSLPEPDGVVLLLADGSSRWSTQKGNATSSNST